MDAKWNKVIDRFSVRLALLALGFGIWLAISYGVLAVAKAVSRRKRVSRLPRRPSPKPIRSANPRTHSGSR